MASEIPMPISGETAVEYTERLNGQDVKTSYAGLKKYFGLSSGCSKSMFIASCEFNARFSYKEWSERRKKSEDGYGARNWLKRKYCLSENECETILDRFESGDERGLLSVLSFSALAERRCMPRYVEEMEKCGVFE